MSSAIIAKNTQRHYNYMSYKEEMCLQLTKEISFVDLQHN